MINITKKCNNSDCNKEKPISEFTKDKSRKDGLSPICKQCASIKNKKQRENNPNYRNNWLLNNQDYMNQWYEKNIDKKKAHSKQYYEENHEVLLTRSKTYQNQNRKERNIYAKKYVKQKYQNPIEKLKNRIRMYILQTLKKNRWKKKQIKF